MPRLMSVALTEEAVRDRRKTVTRRLGWWMDRRGRLMLKQGDRIVLCRKVMGLRPGEKPERLCEVEVVGVRRERLDEITEADVTREGFNGQTRAWFVDFFCEHMKVTPTTEVTRIEWRYLDEAAP